MHMKYSPTVQECADTNRVKDARRSAGQDRRETQLKAVSKLKTLLGVGISAFTSMLLGLEMAFNVYAVQLKETFNITQTDVDLISACGVIGMGASLSETAVTTTFGYKAGYFVIWFFTSVSALLMWLTVAYKEIIRHWPIVICVIQFLISASQNAGTTRMSAIAVAKFSRQHTGKLVGIYFAAIASGKLFHGAVFEVIFDLDLRSFFLALSISYAVSIAVCFCLHRPESELPLCLTDYEVIRVKQSEAIPLLTILSDAFFYLTFWPSVLVLSIQLTLMNNLTSIACSLNAYNPINFVYVLSMTMVFGRLTLGLLYDKFRSDFSGLIIILCASFSTCAAATLLVVWPCAGVLYLVTVLLGLGLSCGASIPSSLLTIRFGQKNLPYIIGLIYCFTAMASLVFQFLVGHLYDSLSLDGSCHGSWCFFLSCLILLGITLLSLGVHGLNVYITVFT